MSEPKLIRPMLDGFAMGKPMSEHHGVKCCPAMKGDSKYIVKILSIPASQVQLDALLLTGAYRSTGDALAYFRELASDVEAETAVLGKLSSLEGFLPYEACQIVPMDDGVGSDVYLLGAYRRSLERFLKKHTMTHLNAVNLGLDLCAAMAVCRRAGYLYADLKPSNVFVAQDNEYRVGDLGFIKLEDLPYTSLPEKYRSAYTAPEIQDAFSTLNPTIDVYAIGLILYQAYNDGRLPFDGQAPEEALPAPAYADYEMAEIILKACAPKPEDRWQDPVAMGQAIVGYMQRNGANDTPIVPFAAPAPSAPAPSPPSEEPESGEYEQLELDELKSILGGEAPAKEEEEAPASGEEPGDGEENPEADIAFLDGLSRDDTTPDEGMAEEIAYGELSADTSDILAQADDLIAHEPPGPAVAPQPIDVPVPPPILPDRAPEEVPQEEEAEDPAEQPEEEPEQLRFSTEPLPAPKKKLPVKKILLSAIAVVLIAAILAGGYIFYTRFYLQTVEEMVLDGQEDRLTVRITSQTEESMLSVVCTDTYGKRLVQPVKDGKADFTGLTANTLYTIKLEITGLHKLIGTVSATYTSPEKTNVANFSVIAGAEDGSVILMFTVDGADAQPWRIVYSTEGEEERSVTTNSHMATISGLTVGKTYSFRLESDSSVYIVGQHTVSYSVTPLVFPENLTIDRCSQGVLSASWQVPEGQTVESWTVRCYNELGFDQTQTVTEPKAEFQGLDCAMPYNVEVTAKGMTAGRRAFVSANSVTAKNVAVTFPGRTTMRISWEYDGPAPEGDWLLLYTVDGSTVQEVVRGEQTSLDIADYVPGGEYRFNLQLESGTSVFGGGFTYKTPSPQNFSGYKITPERMFFRMCRTPDKEDWTRADLTEDSYTTTFAPGAKGSFYVKLTSIYDYPADRIATQFVIRREDGTLVSHAVTVDTWANMWGDRGENAMDIPALPEEPGNYTVEIYFNGAFVYRQAFQIQ